MRSGCSVAAARLMLKILCKIHLQKWALPPRSREVGCALLTAATGNRMLSFCFCFRLTGFG